MNFTTTHLEWLRRQFLKVLCLSMDGKVFTKTFTVIDEYHFQDLMIF